jgi:hypothetical protein
MSVQGQRRAWCGGGVVRRLNGRSRGGASPGRSRTWWEGRGWFALWRRGRDVGGAGTVSGSTRRHRWARRSGEDPGKRCLRTARRHPAPRVARPRPDPERNALARCPGRVCRPLQHGAPAPGPRQPYERVSGSCIELTADHRPACGFAISSGTTHPPRWWCSGHGRATSICRSCIPVRTSICSFASFNCPRAEKRGQFTPLRSRQCYQIVTNSPQIYPPSPCT